MECSMCKSKTFHTSEVKSRGGQGPDLLPGTGFFGHATFALRICAECGFVHWFVEQDSLERVSNSDHFALRSFE